MSGKKRGLSLEEKRKKMLEIFYEGKQFFQLKELEKIAPKAKGIIVQSVKDVVTSLVDDGYVDSDKIGTSVYFWALPSKATQVRKRKLEELSQKLTAVKEKESEVTHKVKRIKLSKKAEEEEELEGLKASIGELKGRREELIRLNAQYEDSDPEVIAKEKAEIKLALEAANRWTDNIFSVKSWIKNKFGMEEAAINKQFDINPELDYLE